MQVCPCAQAMIGYPVMLVVGSSICDIANLLLIVFPLANHAVETLGDFDGVMLIMNHAEWSGGFDGLAFGSIHNHRVAFNPMGMAGGFAVDQHIISRRLDLPAHRSPALSLNNQHVALSIHLHFQNLTDPTSLKAFWAAVTVRSQSVSPSESTSQYSRRSPSAFTR